MVQHRITKLAATMVITAGLLGGTVAAGASPITELARLDALFADATDGSPAQFRLLEERQRLAASGGEHEIAQFRSVEDGRS